MDHALAAAKLRAMNQNSAPESPEPEGRARATGPMMGILIGVPLSIALWLGIAWLLL